MGQHQPLRQFRAVQAAQLGTALDAVNFALKIDEGEVLDPREFLRDWAEGDVSAWPDFQPPPPPREWNWRLIAGVLFCIVVYLLGALCLK